MAVRLTPSGGWADLAGAEDRALTAPDVEPMWSYTGTSAPLDVNTGNALRVSDAYACIRLLADSVSSLALKAYRRLPEGRVPAGDNARITQLLQRPSPGSTMVDLLSQMMVHANLYGESFVGLYRADGEIVQLGLIHPESVQVELKGRRVVYTLSTDKGLVDVGVDDVLHVKGMSVDGLRGLSPVTQARVALGLSSSLQQSAKVFTEKGSRPSGVLSLGQANPGQVGEASEVWKLGHAGVDNMHRVAVVAGDVKFEPISFSADDSQFLQQRELSAREVARIFRVPAWAIDAPTGDSLTYSNTTEQARALVTHSLRPWLVRIERAISNCAALCPGATFVEFELDGLLRADAKTRAETYTAALDPETGWMRRDEIRRLENLEPE